MTVEKDLSVFEIAKKKTARELQRARMLAKKRKGKPKDPERSRAAKKGHRRNPMAAKAAAKSRARLYNSEMDEAKKKLSRDEAEEFSNRIEAAVKKMAKKEGWKLSEVDGEIDVDGLFLKLSLYYPKGIED